MATCHSWSSVKVLEQPNGDVLVTTTAGLLLPTHGIAIRSAPADANVQPGSVLSGRRHSRRSCSVAPTSPASSSGGQIGANITLRDTTLPTDQAELDEFVAEHGDPVCQPTG